MVERVRVRAGVYNCPGCGAAASPGAHRCGYCGSSLASDVCPSCFGAVFHGMKHCPSCGEEYRPADPGARSPLGCPRCREAFAELSLGRHTLQQCPECGGLWLDRQTVEGICADHEEQEAVLSMGGDGCAAPGEKGRGRKGRAYVPCPVCSKLMNRSNFVGAAGVVVDWCKQHGTWFDRGELARILSFIRSGGMRMAREREKRKLEDARLRLRAEQFRISSLCGRLGDGSVAGLGADLDGPSLLEILSGLKHIT